MNGFVLHGQGHTSPSSINMWVESPDAWLARYLFKRQFSMGAAAKAGIAVEEAISNVLRGQYEESATKAALENYNKAILFLCDASARDRIETIPAMVKMGLEQLKPYGEPEWEDGKQKKINITANCGYFKLPVIGYLDFHFPKHGMVVDLKTTSRMPSSMSASHKRQEAIYRKAMGNQRVGFLYLTPKKSAWLENPAPEETLTDIKTILTRQEKFLSVSKDPSRLAELVHVTDSYYWSGSEGIRAELFGL